MSLVSLKNVSRFYDAGEHKVKALSNVKGLASQLF